MKRKTTAGIQSFTLEIIIHDTSSTTGGGLSGVTHSSSGLVFEYRRQGQSSWTSVTPVSATLGTYTSGGIVASGSRAGRYEIGIPDAALAAGARFVQVCLRGVANMYPVDIEIELDQLNYQDSVRAGLTALPNVAAGANGGLPTGDSSGRVTLAAVTHTGATVPTVTAVTNGVTVATNNDKTGYSLTQSFPSNFASLAITAGGAVTIGTNNDKTGYSLTQSFPSNFASLSVDTSGRVLLQPTQTGVTIPTVTSVTNAVVLPSSASINITGNITGNLSGSVGSVTGAVTVGTNNDKTGYSLSTSGIQAIWDALTSALTTAGSIGKWILDNLNATVSSRATQTSVDAIDDFVNTEVAAIKTVTDKLDTMLELDGLVYRYTTNALEQAPSGGGGGSTDWTSDERTAIRAILGIPTSGTTPTDPTTGILDTIRDLVVVVDTVVDRIEVDTQDIQSRLPASLQDGRIVAYVGVNGDKTGYSLLVAPPTAATIADAVWDEPYNQHTTAGTFGKLLDILRKANYVTEGTVAAGGTPTNTVFRTSLTNVTGTFDNQTILFISGALEGQSAPIESYSQTNGTMTLGDALTAAPTAGDTFVILPDHVHPLGEIAGAVWADTDADDVIRDAVGLGSANLDTQLSAALVLQKLAASGATGSVQVTDNGNGTATLVFKDTNGSTTLATVTYNYTTGARTRVS